MTMTENVDPSGRREQSLAVVQRFYEALATNDGSQVVPVLTEDFVLTVAEGMPSGLGGVYHGSEHAVANTWTRIWELFYVHGEPAEVLAVADDPDRFMVLGRYVGETPDGAALGVDAAFAHILTVRGDRLAVMQQITDTAQWMRFQTRDGD